MFNTIWITIYTLALLGIAVFGFHTAALVFLFLKHKKRKPESPANPNTWPTLTVQLPVYNEQLVVERLIDAVCTLDYPKEALSIQVLDDSTDKTTEIARRYVDMYKKKGVCIELLHRSERVGFKGGALAAGLRSAPGEMIAVFDADFAPPPDSLKRLVPYLTSNPSIGMVQGRWGHLNATYNPITRSQALSLDGQFVVVQTARSRAGLIVKFNGSAGIWRRECIEDAGGWEGDTLTEDLDLSFRAQIQGWRLIYIPEVVVPAEITPHLAAYKQQQYRWAHGSVRVLLKLGRRLLRAPLPITHRLEGLVHLSAYIAHLIMLFMVVVCLPVILINEIPLPSLPWFWILGLSAPILFALSQQSVYPDWKRRFLYFPVLVLLGIGMGLNNSLAVLDAFSGRSRSFARTPKFRIESRRDSWLGQGYILRANWTVFAELALAGYAFVAMVVAIRTLPRLAPALGLIALSYGFVGGLGLLQDRINLHALRRKWQSS